MSPNNTRARVLMFSLEKQFTTDLLRTQPTLTQINFTEPQGEMYFHSERTVHPSRT